MGSPKASGLKPGFRLSRSWDRQPYGRVPFVHLYGTHKQALHGPGIGGTIMQIDRAREGDMCTLVTTRRATIAIWSFALLFASSDLLLAQEGPLRPGEAFVTRFSGIQQTGPQDNPVAS